MTNLLNGGYHMDVEKIHGKIWPKPPVVPLTPERGVARLERGRNHGFPGWRIREFKHQQ